MRLGNVVDYVFEASHFFLLSAFQVMRDLFPAILSLSEIFVHSADACIVSYGSCMYKEAFTAFDSYCQQVLLWIVKYF